MKESSRQTHLLEDDTVNLTWQVSGPKEIVQLSSARWRERKRQGTLGLEETAKLTHSPSSTGQKQGKL